MSFNPLYNYSCKHVTQLLGCWLNESPCPSSNLYHWRCHNGENHWSRQGCRRPTTTSNNTICPTLNGGIHIRVWEGNVRIADPLPCISVHIMQTKNHWVDTFVRLVCDHNHYQRNSLYCHTTKRGRSSMDS